MLTHVLTLAATASLTNAGSAGLKALAIGLGGGLGALGAGTGTAPSSRGEPVRRGSIPPWTSDSWTTRPCWAPGAWP